MPETSTLWIACSGGVDSVVLLDLVSKWQQSSDTLRIHVIHVNHQLSAIADQWQQHVTALCKAYKIPLICKSVEVEQSARTSLEAEAREARYRAIFECAQANDIVLLGHHLDDQIETVLLRLMRGSGPKGLAAMKVFSEQVRNEKRLQFVRPLLSVPKSSILEYAEKRNLQWVNDESNADQAMDRNFLRNSVLSSMREHFAERWPGMQNAVFRSAQLCEQNQATLEFLLEEKLATCIVNFNQLSRSALIKLDQRLWPELLRLWLSRLTAVVPSAAVLQQIIQALESKADQVPLISWNGHELRMHADSLYFLRSEFVAKSLATPIVLQQPVVIQDCFGEQLFISIDGVSSAKLTIRVVKDEDSMGQQELLLEEAPKSLSKLALRNDIGDVYFAENMRGKARPLKRWFKDWQIPPWYRVNVVGLFLADRLLAVIDNNGVRINHQ